MSNTNVLHPTTMKKLSNFFFSMSSMGVLILIFAGAIATATFIENDFGTTAAKAVVYNATWFNLLLVLLAINLVANIFRYRMYRRKKLVIFLFHFAFLVILLGAAITRFVSFEGMMHLREGETGNSILSDRTYIETVVNTDGHSKEHSQKVLLSVLSSKAYSDHLSINHKSLRLKAIQYIPNAQQVITNSDTGSAYLSLVTSAGFGRHNVLLKEGTSQSMGKYTVQFGGAIDSTMISIQQTQNGLTITAPDTIKTTSMSGGPSETYYPNQTKPFETGKLFTVGSLNMVLTHFYQHGTISYATRSGKEMNLMDVVVVEAHSGNKTKIVNLQGGKGYKGEPVSFTINGMKVKMQYGSKEIQLPFALRLRDFQLKRYPGSMSPSSYASEVTLIDKANNIDRNYRIYMNHVLDYKGYRFFQSSYDRDELGSILSVNHDYWGTFFTYLGYFLMALGMALSLFIGDTHFAKLGKILRKKKTVSVVTMLLLFLVFSSTLKAQHSSFSTKSLPAINKAQAKAFGELMVQSQDGRLKPVNTLASEVLRKVTRKSSFHGLSPDEVLLGMLSNPMYWQQVPMIKISNKKVSKLLGVKGKYASYLDFINSEQGTYKLSDFVSTVYAKNPGKRDMFDKEIMKVDERLNICYMIYTEKLLSIIPNPKNPDAPWYNPTDTPVGLPYEDSLLVTSIVPQYLNTIQTGKLKMATQLINGLKRYQRKYGAAIMPSEGKIKAELLYNRLQIFDRLSMVYGMLGLLMILLLFAQIFKDTKAIRGSVKVLLWLTVLGFVIQTFGLALRWYISGHAPWSGGYEAMVYIGWVTMLAGLLFSKRSLMTVAATTILTSIILMVAHLSWMDPEITNLVPVLKSYWLTIHVSVITASYGFLALGALLGFLNLLLMILTSRENREKMKERIGELTAINERTLIVGLYMLTIGTFLGGVWANESWGRYWGWDPKETWALVSVLVYSFIMHMRFIPGLKSKFSFNFASLIGYFSILMTFFGVNYYLSGLHSYAKGDPVPIPDFVYYTVGTIFLLSAVAYYREKRFDKIEE